MRNMDQTPMATTLLNLLFPPYFLLLLLPLVFFIHRYITSMSSRRPPLPPGPRPWPIIGNIHQLGKELHISITRFAKLHGPLISLRLGTRVFIVASSPMAAKEILHTHDRLFSARSIPKAFPYKSGDMDRVSIAWNSTCNDRWKSLRALCRTELFSNDAIESQAPMREKKLMEMVEFLSRKQGQVVNLCEVVFTCTFNLICNLLLSKDLLHFEDEDRSSGLKEIVSRLMELSTAPNIADFYPILAELDPQGIKKQMSHLMKEMFAVWENHVKERRETHVHSSTTTDFLDVFLAKDFDDDQINWLFFELLMAGSETTSTTVEWIMTELLKNNQLMKKACEEVDREIKRKSIKESHISKLDYLNACVKESMRLHPPGAFLYHSALETCEIMNYTIPKNAGILVNMYRIGRDPSVWEEPLLYNPSRFLGSKIDFKGHNFELIPFGSGRRTCAGLPMAARQLHLILAYLIYYFDWSLPNGEDFANLDTTEKFGLTLPKQQHLLLIPTRRRI